MQDHWTIAVLHTVFLLTSLIPFSYFDFLSRHCLRPNLCGCAATWNPGACFHLQKLKKHILLLTGPTAKRRTCGLSLARFTPGTLNMMQDCRKGGSMYYPAAVLTCSCQITILRAPAFWLPSCLGLVLSKAVSPAFLQFHDLLISSQ